MLDSAGERRSAMLEPESRHLLLDSLRPPAGYALDRAFGTTYSLDLAALLTAPVAFALIDRERADGAPVTDPVRLLEAVRRYAERIDIFCQAGLIGLPGQYQPIVSYLESTVHEVEAPTPGGIFHPKVWFIRYRQEDGEGLHYRLLCLSRNLTFDRSWDTVLRLEGTPGEVDEVSEPLAIFLEQMPGRCRQSLPPATDADLRQLAGELRSVTFQPPAGIDRLRFWPLGLGTSWPFESRIDRMLIVSPFLTAGCLDRLNRKGAAGRDVLISRLESLDRLGATALTRFADTLALHSGTDTTDSEAETQGPQSESAAERPGIELRGLHAKLYVADAGWRGKVWTGSANATDAAFGPNVEFMVEMEGRKDRCGVDAFLSRGQDGLSLRDLLETYRPASDDPLPPTDEDRLERRLDVARRDLASFHFHARATPDGERFSVQLVGSRRRPPVGDAEWASITARCRPLTMAAAYAKPVDVTEGELEVDFGSTSFEALTSFFAFELESREEKATLSVGFLVNAELIGAPTDRRERILVNLLKNRADLLRFLIFLLGADTREGSLIELGPDILKGLSAHPNGDGQREVPWQNLFEPMVRALAHDPRKLDEIGRLVRDLQLTDEGTQLLPDDWAAIWEPIWSVRQGMAKQ
jgi:hypothetical protein